MKHGFYIGNIYIDGELCLGPMAGVSDLPFRILCKEQGCSLLCTEMVSAKAILYGNKNTDILLRTNREEAPLAVQLFGSDPDILAEIAARLEEGPYDIIDFNMGCPVPKIVGNREGSALMREPALVEKILSAMTKKLKKPLTVKIRKGFDEAHVNASEIARIAESCGAAAVAVHARTREQFYSGSADWSIIREVKEAVKIPVIGNGDVKNGRDAKRMLEETGCDGVMLARAAQGDPWIFSRIASYLEKGEEEGPVDHETIKSMMLRHLEMQIEHEGEYMGIRQMRKHIAWYTHGFKDAARFRNRINHLEKAEEIREMILQL